MKGEERKKRVLVVDDEENLRHMLQVMLRKHGYLVDTAADGSEACRMAAETRYHFILCDLRMPVMDGVRFLEKAVEAGLDATIIMMSAYGTMDTAIACMKQGAYDYISKPFKKDEILLVLRKAEERERLKTENRRLREEVLKESSFAGIVSRNGSMLDICALIRKVCDFRTTVLILGESGTGKELVARALHDASKRSGGPFVAVNCGAIPEQLLESELFGHVKGAFTDASGDKAGLFEQANGGTLLLDEIGELPLLLQVKLLRVLQDGEIRRVGGTGAKKVDVRVISATSRDLGEEVSRGRFREDLYFRLNVLAISLPPLRERMEDVPLLVDHFLLKYGQELGREGVGCSPEVTRILLRYPWPGNVRELENCIHRSLLLCEGDLLEPECLPESVRGAEEGRGGDGAIPPPADGSLSIKRLSEQLEREMIRKALEKTSGNRTRAARLLEISHRSLLYKIKEYDIE